ncbi:Altronate oxidoreductase [Tepidanaerobacter acetatoxydans Re1]|uniref:Altronate oxidoreductase n=1 Tax=Tepidanaerobacter acetatoxydans (strain DSM 21804 / JCM 16047 / Re1) TaxID=1209989 RepID=F4LWC5_TEPAE|nr:tagaturonate reductase [Tepidanaerobacter acetatoxydans]AEE91723.1 Tagaturonate reductase [Tepidanaerobacter acetatoxydans Re1]CCP26489.1 Altronate oxidoreductase [Tepidanaerobacter acetatoxydans Re1]
MVKLNKELLKSDFKFPKDLMVQPFPDDLPERVIQFGEGNFLRAFVDWMFHQMNKQNLFNGRVVVVQPIAQGLVDRLNEQDGLYTLILRGLKDGKPTELKEIISSISRGINPYTQWDEYLKCAENPDIEFVISNTTEAGISYDKNDSLDKKPPISYPGKLTAYLYHRFNHFKGDPTKGMVIIPCELIDRNGDNLKKIILQLSDDWSLPEEFKKWIKDNNIFLNTLVDRVVTGYPKDEIEDILNYLGYEDGLVDTGELFHLWVIEGPKELSERLPFTKAGLNVLWTDDMAPYRTRKVRILNGAHTSSVPAAFLYGLETVGEMMDHEVLGKFARQVIYDEIIPSINLDKNMLTEFADSVVERFQNPYIKHYLISILLNSSSKFKTRVLPSIIEYQQLYSKLPEKLTFSLAALISVYKDGKVEGSEMKARRNKGEFIMKDDLWALEFFEKTWSEFDGSKEAAKKVAETVIANSKMWDQDLNNIDGLTDKVADYLYQITNDGIKATVERLV